VGKATTAETTMKPSLYMFDEVFSLEPAGARASPPPVSSATLAEAVAKARDEGRAAGVAEGRRAAEAAIAGRLATSVEKIVSAVAELGARAEADRAEIEAMAATMAMTAAGRLAPALVAREPTGEIAELLHNCLEGIREVPHVAVRISADLVEPMRARFDQVAAQTGFAGRIVVLGEPDIAPGDGRVEWADGGIVRDMDETRRAIEVAVADFVAARSGGAAEPAPLPVTSKDETDG
jgi:flagellar assembly protein FliH